MVLTVVPCPPVSVGAPVLIRGSNSPPFDRSTCTSGGSDCHCGCCCSPPECRLRCYIQWFRCHSQSLCCRCQQQSHGRCFRCLHGHPNPGQDGPPRRARELRRRRRDTTWASSFLHYHYFHLTKTPLTLPKWAPLLVASLPHRKLSRALIDMETLRDGRGISWTGPLALLNI